MRIIPRMYVFILIMLLSLGVSAPSNQPADDIFYPETGHSISGEFLAYFRIAEDPLRVFGYPITEAIEDPLKPGNMVQYFQRARLEYNPKAAAGSRVTQAPLGSWFAGDPNQAELVTFQVSPGACRNFTETNISVCYSFLQFYERYNGTLFLGAPIREPEMLSGRIVQYFEKGRLEWQAEIQHVALSHLGRMDFDRRIGDPRLLEPVNKDQRAINAQNTRMSVHAFTARPLIQPNGSQTLFIIVQDQYLKPIPSAMISVTVTMPDGQRETFRPAITNADGLTQLNFSIGNLSPTQVVQVEVSAEVFNGAKAQGTTWFRVWW